MSLTRPMSILGACLALFVQGCTGLSSNSGNSVDYDHSYDFSQVRKIAIQQAEVVASYVGNNDDLQRWSPVAIEIN